MRRTVGWLWLLLAAACACGGEETFPRTTEAGAQLKELENLPAAVEYRELQKALDEIQRERAGKYEEIHDKQQKLQQSPAYQDYLGKRRELEDRRQDSWEIERKAMAEAAKKLYAARHEEVRKAARAELPEAARLGLDALNYPTVDGSTSTGPLSVAVAARVLGVPYEWVYPEPTGHPWPNRTDLRGHFLSAGAPWDRGDHELILAALRVVAKPARREQTRTALLINSLLATSSSTHDGYVNLITGKTDLNLTARAPSESELKLAREKGVELKLEPVARDAFVMIVSHKNPVQGLTRAQVRDIYEEKIKDWAELGREKGGIRAFRRERDSGSRELFDALVMEGKALPEDQRHGPLYAAGMGGPYSRLTRDPDGLGYSVYYYEHFMAASPYTRVLPIDGVEPSAESIASGRYPWTTKVYVAYRAGERPDSPALKLVRWLLSPEGQAVVRESGYVPETAAGAEPAGGAARRQAP